MSETQKGQPEGQQVRGQQVRGQLRDTEKTPRGVFSVGPRHPQPSHLVSSLADVRRRLLQETQLGTWPNRLDPGSEQSGLHKPPSLRWGGEGARVWLKRGLLPLQGA